MRCIESRKSWKTVCTVECDAPRDSAPPLAKLVEDVERPTTSGSCSGQCGECSKTGDLHGSVG